MKQQPLSTQTSAPTVALPAMLRLAEREHLPLRLREILQGLLTLSGSVLGPPIDQAMAEFETQLVRLADKAPNEQQNGYFDSVHELKRGRAEVLPRFLRHIESALASLGEEVMQPSRVLNTVPVKHHLALTESAQLDESLVLADIATKVEVRVREPLYALGNRFGVLAGTPRMSAETMPLGPRSIIEALRHATSSLDLVLEHRLVLYRCFERVVLIGIASFYNTLNDYLVEQGILSHLHKLATRLPGSTAAVAANAAKPTTGESLAGAAPVGLSPVRVASLHRVTNQPIQDSHTPDLFADLRQLLGECRRAEVYTASSEDMQSVLTALQARQAAGVTTTNKPELYSGEQIKQEMLAVLRELSADGRAPRIAEEDSDTIDLVAMLFEFLSRRARSSDVTNWILLKLQMPILRVAIKDKSFFSDKAHPARRVLGNVVEFAQSWADETHAHSDPVLIGKLQFVTNQIASEYKGDIAVFSQALQDLSEYSNAIVQNLGRAEQRLVEAAIGREKLQRLRVRANAAISERIAAHKPNEFLRVLLEQAWTDVLAASLLHDGGESSNYTRRLEVADQLLARAEDDDRKPSPVPTDLSAEVEVGLAQVGLHYTDVQAIIRKLFATSAEQVEDPISQTELIVKLRGKAEPSAHSVASPAESIQAVDEQASLPLTHQEMAAFDRIRTLAPGTWFEFVINEQGDTVRRKLSWYSALSGRCLLINQHGTPTGEQTQEHLAREMAGGRARVAGTEQDSLLDRAWTAIIETLKYFSTHKLDNYFGTTTLADRALDIHRRRIAEHAGTPQEQGTRTLLLVDDEENILRALTRVLRSGGYRILTAASAREALEILGAHEIQVIVSDQRMPEVSGLEFLTQVKKMYPETVRIMLSGYSDAAAVTDAINRATIYKFLTKPWNDEDIQLQVRDAFDAYTKALESA